MIYVSTISSFFINPWVNGLILGLMVLGVFISFRILDIADLSVEGIVPMITLFTAALIGDGLNPWLVLFLSIIIGAVCGVMNALLTIYLKTPPLLSGIIVMALTFGVGIMINSLRSGSVSFDASSSQTVFNWLQNVLNSIAKDWDLSSKREFMFWSSYLSYIIVALVILLLISAVIYFFFGTELGMAIRAVGKNKTMARANGININRMMIIGLAISGGLVGLSATLYGQHNTMGLPTDGQGMIVIGLSSLFLGETIFSPRSFKMSLVSAIAGSIIYWYLIQILMLIDTQGFMLSIYKALLLILIIGVQLLIAVIKDKIGTGGRNKEIEPGNGPSQTRKQLTSMKESFVRHCLGERSVC